MKRALLPAVAVGCLLAGCTQEPPGFDGSYESREQEKVTVTEYRTPPACRRVVRLARRIDNLWFEVDRYGEFGDLIIEAAQAATYRDGAALNRVMDRYGELGDEQSAQIDEIVALAQRRNTAASQCLEEQ